MSLFVAKFDKVSDTGTFETDKNGRLPYIGTVLAGIAKNSIYNGTMFQRENRKEGQMYLCENVVTTDEEGNKYNNINIISEVTVTEFMAIRKELGEGILSRPTASSTSAPTVVAEDIVAEPVAQPDPVEEEVL